MPKKIKSISRLANDCAELLQRLVRIKSSDLNGFSRCVTCGKQDQWTNLQGGHFIERGRLATKLVEENIHPQCSGCNMYRMKTASGILDYRLFMTETYGEEFVMELHRLSRSTKKYTRSELEEIKADLKIRLEEQQERLGA